MRSSRFSSVWGLRPRSVARIAGIGAATMLSVVGSGALSATPASAAPATVPDAPGISHAAPGNGQAEVFTVPFDGGSPIISFTATATDTTTPGNGGQQGTGAMIPGATFMYVTVGGLTNGDSYTVTVTATNSVGTSLASGATAPVTPAFTPSTPTNVSAYFTSPKVYVAFTLPASDGGSPLTQCNANATDTTNPANSFGVGANPSSPIWMPNPRVGDSYTFAVECANIIGFSGLSSPSTPFTIPGSTTSDPPTIYATPTAGNGQATVTFRPSASTGGSAITSYTVTAVDSTNGANGGQTASASASPITVTGLTNGDSYSLTVQATNNVGTGTFSSLSNPVTPTAVVTPPARCLHRGPTPAPSPAGWPGWPRCPTAPVTGSPTPTGPSRPTGMPSATARWRVGPSTRPSPTTSPAPRARATWLVASDGGTFAFGDAAFHGSMGGQHLNQQVVGISVDLATGGYWEVATDGGVFAFGAPFFGSTGNIHLNQPVNGMTTTANSQGYWFVASDGGIFAFGNAGFHGSAAGTAQATIMGMASDYATGGYWLVDASGNVYS